MTTTHEQSNDAPAAEPKAAATQTTTIEGHVMAEKVKELLHEANVRRIIVKNAQGDTVMELPVTAGVIVAVALPIVTAVTAVAALANDWKLEVHRAE